MTEKTIAQQMQEILPGSTTFAANILCPRCGWHFKAGLTDPQGLHTKVEPGMAIICGQCLTPLKTTEQGLEKMTVSDYAGMSREDQVGLFRSWQMAFIALQVTGPEPSQASQ